MKALYNLLTKIVPVFSYSRLPVNDFEALRFPLCCAIQNSHFMYGNVETVALLARTSK